LPKLCESGKLTTGLQKRLETRNRLQRGSSKITCRPKFWSVYTNTGL